MLARGQINRTIMPDLPIVSIGLDIQPNVNQLID